MYSRSFSIIIIPFLFADASTTYLKEIIQGRCYDLLPSGDVRDCPAVVDTFMAVLESQLDSDLTPNSFYSHFESMDFSFSDNKSVAFLPYYHSSNGRGYSSQNDRGWKSTWTSPSDSSSWIIPEHTPNGAFLAGLVFCGVDLVDNCSLEYSNAYWTYWEALYGRIAANTRGDIQIKFSPPLDAAFIQRSIVDKIDPTKVSSVTIYGDGCTTDSDLVTVIDAFRHAGVGEVICSDDPIEFILCALNRNSKECVTYLNSCIHHQPNPAASTIPSDNSTNTVTEQQEREQGATSHSSIEPKQNPGFFVAACSIVILSLIFGWLVYSKRQGSLESWNAMMDKISEISSISSNSQRRRREQAVQESSALLDEVTRNLFMDQNYRENDRDMETVILQ